LLCVCYHVNILRNVWMAAWYKGFESCSWGGVLDTIWCDVVWVTCGFYFLKICLISINQMLLQSDSSANWRRASTFSKLFSAWWQMLLKKDIVRAWSCASIWKDACWYIYCYNTRNCTTLYWTGPSVILQLK
jgi:hypothetical protein